MPPPDLLPSEPSLTLPVKYLVKRAPVFVERNTTVAEAARVMQKARVGSVLVADDPPGIVTDRDLRDRVLAAGLGPDAAVEQIMTRPLKMLDSDALVFTALRLMLEENIRHLVLVEEGKIVAVISATDLLHTQASSPFYLRRALDSLDDPVMLPQYGRDIAGTVQGLFHGGLGAIQIGEIVSSLNDALIKRLVQLSELALGPAPAPFAWLVFGSEGRLEQALLTDQDNALLYADSSAEASRYFAEMAKRVVDGLIAVGFPPCAGGFMATRWCKSLGEWRHLFATWVRTPEPEAILDAAIFFDFRAVAGTLSLDSLDDILAAAGTEKIFIAHMAREALRFAPPLGFFNRLRSDDGAVDLKKGGIAPIVGIARAAALAAGSRERSTLERLAAAGKSGAILKTHDATLLAETFQFLMQLRLRHQLESLRTKRPLDNRVRLEALSTLEYRHLKEAFVTIRQIQDDVRAALHLERMI